MPNSQVGAPWVIIPLRSSDESDIALPRKNFLALASKSLLTRAVETAKTACQNAVAGAQVLAVVDSPEALEAASRLEILVVQVTKVAASAEAVVGSVAEHLRTIGATDSDSIVVLDPALALVAPQRIIEAHRALQQSFMSVSLVYQDQPVLGFAAAKLLNFAGANAFSQAPHLTLSVTEPESVYISTQTDWAVANHFATQLRILIRTDVSEVLDQSHAARALALADALANHKVSIVLSKQQTLNDQYFRNSQADLIEIDDDLELLAVARKENADLVVLDHHLNTAEFVALMNGFCKVVTVEDFGSGAEQATLALNSMFENTQLDDDHQLVGLDATLVPVDFESAKLPQRFSAVVKEIVICFSGQDMNGLASLTLRALDSLGFDGKVTVVRGLGADLVNPESYKLKVKVLSNVKDFAAVFKTADLAVTSADYMLTMLSAAGVPALTLAQNTQEVLNSQAKFSNGSIALGFGSLISEESLAAHLDRLIEDVELRQSLHERALKAFGVRSNAKVANRLLRMIGF